MKFRDSQPGRSVSGDQNSGQWPIFRPYVAASNKTGMSEKQKKGKMILTCIEISSHHVHKCVGRLVIAFEVGFYSFKLI